MYCSSRRRAYQILHPPAFRRRGQSDSHGRKPREWRQAAPASSSVRRRGCDAMRLLRFRNAHGGPCPAGEKQEPERARHPRSHARQHLSLLCLPPHGESDSARRESDGAGREAMSLTLSRRQLLKRLGGGILVAVLGPGALAQRESGRGGGQRQGGNVPQNLSAWLHIGPDGVATVYTGKVEVGQNARTSLSQAVAEELCLPIASVKMVMGDTELCPFDQGTFGSRTTPAMMPQLRRAAATAREALVELAAKK